jgi:hypothetical protein
MPTDWNSLRPWKNSQNSAFEELCCQLAEYESVPQGSRFIRKGTPDGGVECFWIFPTGGEWGWQAKFLSLPFGSSKWQQIDKSVYDALGNHPNLIRYTICLPFDRPDAGGKDGEKSFLDAWNEHESKWRDRAQSLGRSVEFEYWGEHAIYTRLSEEKHAGRYKFWFNKEFLSQAWFANHIKEVIENAGDRYTPEINVNLPIARIFESLGRTPEFFTEIDSLHKEIKKAFWHLGTKKLNEIVPVELLDVQQKIASLLKDLTEMRTYGWGQLPLKDLGSIETNSVQRCAGALRERAEKQKQAQEKEQEQQNQALDIREESYELTMLLRSLYELNSFAGSSRALAANQPSVLVIGAAGSGKTHLLCDVAERRIKSAYPTVMLLGEQFGEDEPWKQMISLLKLDCTRDELLGALDAAALASGVRALILIDALNEGEGQKVWKKHIAGILANLENYPRVGIAVSVRDSYVDAIVPNRLIEERKFIQEIHLGFEEHQYEAANRFFAHFGIEPSVPLLYPEFRNPQFLLLFCKSLRNRHLSRVPPGLHGISSVFDFYLDSINEKLSVHIDFDPADLLVQKATEAVARAMAEQSNRWLTRDAAKSIVNALLPDREFNRSLFRHLVVEGLLAEDLTYKSGGADPEPSVRFSYERFADYRIAKLMLDRHLDKNNPTESFALGKPMGELFKDHYTYWLNKGLVEALCVLLPEEVSKELPDLLPEPSKNVGQIRVAFVGSLLWRSPKAFNSETLRYINDEVLRFVDSNREFWETVLTLAAVPDHPLNANRLHVHLSAFSMADRDSRWSTFIHRRYEAESAVDRLLDWASSPFRKYKLERSAAILYGTAVCWLFTSSNRFLRDHATKSLVQAIDDDIDVLVALIDKFRNVNDPYVKERICAVAYGCAMKTTDAARLKNLATAMYDWIFSGGKPYSHILVRDYARGVIEAALQAGPCPEVDPRKIRPPYKSTWPKKIPPEAELKSKYGWDQDGMPQAEWARLSIYHSVMDWGDFARYVIGTNSGSFEWSDIKLGKRPTVTAKEKHDAFVDGLRDDQRKAWDKFQELHFRQIVSNLRRRAEIDVESDTGGPSEDSLKDELKMAEKKFEATLNPTERRIYRRDVVAYPEKARREEHRFDIPIAQRWILQRVFDLGWSVEKHGNFDRDVNAHLYSRDAKKAERIGKKYQWIAYHEFLGLVADRFEFGNYIWGDRDRKYEGPWQIYGRDIDPSCVLRDIPGGEKADDSWWLAHNTYKWLPDEPKGAWIKVVDDLPDVEPLIGVSNPKDGTEWLVLQSYPEWRQPVPAYEDDFGISRRWLWYQIRSFVVQSAKADEAFSWLSNQHFWGRIMPENPEHNGAFLGEFYWAKAARHDPIFDPEKEEGHRLSGLRTPLIFTSGTYHSGMNSFDCSSEQTFQLFLPGAWIVDKMGLRWNGKEGQFFDASGELVALDPAVHFPGPNALLIRKGAFLKFLKSEGYEILWFLLGAKQTLGGYAGPKDWPGELQISGAFRVQDDKVVGKIRPKFISH